MKPIRPESNGLNEKELQDMLIDGGIS